MLDWMYFGSALGVTIALTLTVALIMRGPLFSVLQHICGTDIGARFWTLYALVMMVVGPLFLVAAFVKDAVDLINFLRATLAMTAFGVITTFVIMGWAVGRTIGPKHQAPIAAPAEH